jgi:plasmid stabilization system protein ParE
MRILWLRRAEQDFSAICEYLLERDPAAALNTFEAIQEKVSVLADHPDIGRPGRVEDTRELVITQAPYIVAYTVDVRRDILIILRVLHARQRWPEDFDR